MSQHSQRTQFGPSRGQVVVVGLSTAASAAGTAYVFTMPGFSVRELVACLMGATLTGLLGMHTLSLAADRAVARDRAERAAERERREISTEHAELNAWQNAAAGLLDAYLTGRAVNFGGEPVPDYVRARLADLPGEPVPTSPAYEDRPPVAPPMYPDRSLDLTEPIPAVREPEYEDRREPVDAHGRTWAEAWRVYHANHPEVMASWAEQNGRWPNCPGPECNPGREPEEPLEYVADPARPWRAFEPDQRVAVPLPPREVPVSPGRGWHGDETEVISRVRDEGETQVIHRS